MRVRKLHDIIREALVQRGYPIHYYIDFLAFAKDCLLELNFDTLSTAKSAKVTVEDWMAFELPNDYVDFIRLGSIANGQFIEWVQDPGIPEYVPVDGAAGRVPFDGQLSSERKHDILGSNDLGQDLGRDFSHGAGVTPFRYRISLSRKEIQLATMPSEPLYLEYITDGMTLEASNLIHPYAEACIKTYIDWKLKLKQTRFTEYERQKAEDHYYNELRKLKARLNPLTITDIIQIAREGLVATPKL